MHNYNLLNDYVYIKEIEYIDDEKDCLLTYNEEVLITDFYRLITYLTDNLINTERLELNISFDELYNEVIEEVRYQYDSEIDELFIDDVIIQDIIEIIKITNGE